MSQPAGAKGGVTIVEPDRIARTVARRSAEARATVPDVELSIDVTVDDPATITTGTLVGASASGLRAVPRANGAYRDGRFELYSRINIGVVVATDDAYAIPTIFDADEKSTAEIDEELERLTARTRAGELLAPEASGATFTLWHPGLDGVAQATPLVIPPQAGALAAGAVREATRVRDAAIVPGHTMTITLACDHRILYGPHASRLLGHIKRVIEDGTR
jgi:pyruvate dehydrogenase E2 component (dihydrolipoamide acetyltransferase)